MNWQAGRQAGSLRKGNPTQLFRIKRKMVLCRSVGYFGKIGHVTVYEVFSIDVESTVSNRS
jgi:hypothetical protein